jgi:hypothetical protein
MQSNRKDALLTKVTALPAQNTNSDSAAIDLEVLNGASLPDALELEISIPATPNLADGQTTTTTIQDSADGTTFAAVAGLAALVRTGAGGAGAAASSRRYKLPSTVRRYVRENTACSATAGNNTAVSRTLRLLS